MIKRIEVFLPRGLTTAELEPLPQVGYHSTLSVRYIRSALLYMPLVHTRPHTL